MKVGKSPTGYGGPTGLYTGNCTHNLKNKLHCVYTIYLFSSLLDVGELLGEEGRREDLVDGDAARPGDFADVVGEVALVAAGVRQLRLRDFQADLRKSRQPF